MGGFIPCSVHWFVVGKRESFWDGSCGDTNHCTMCCTGTSEHLLPLTSLVSAPGTWGVEWGPVFVVQIKTSTGRLCHTNGVHCGESSCLQIRECAGWLHGNHLWRIWHHVPQKNTLLLSLPSLECFEVFEHRTRYSKLLERNWRWLSLVDDCCVCCSGSWVLLFNITLGQ